MAALFDLLSRGGPVLWLLAVLSVVSLALIAMKTIDLLTVTSGGSRRDEALSLWSKGAHDKAVAKLQPPRAPADRILSQAMQALAGGKDRDEVERDAEWRGNAELSRLSKSLRILDLIALISPLLGLLGTVLGMIRAFQELALAEGAANASLLAAGIWQALLTTAAGLVVAIPAAVAAAILAGRVDRAGAEIESSVGHLLTIKAGE